MTEKENLGRIEKLKEEIETLKKVLDLDYKSIIDYLSKLSKEDLSNWEGTEAVRIIEGLIELKQAELKGILTAQADFLKMIDEEIENAGYYIAGKYDEERTNIIIEVLEELKSQLKLLGENSKQGDEK